MNELLFTNAHGLRLITGFEGEPRLRARLCEGGKFELGYGITFDLDGQPFSAESTCTPEYAAALFRNALKLFEDGVRRLVTVPLNSNQFSGLVAFAYNVGIENLAGSTVLRRVNEGRMDDAAASFGMWVFATKNGHKQALRGLLRRRYAEACLFMGYDWAEACDNDAIALQRQIPDALPGVDRVIYKTPFKDVLSVAQRYPLTPLDESAEPFDIDLFEKEVAKATEPSELLLTTPAPSPPKAEEAAQRQPAPARTTAAGAAPVETKASTTVSGPVGAAPVKPTDPVAPQPVPMARPAPAPDAPVRPTIKPAPMPPVIAGQDGTKPPSPFTLNPKDVPYRIDPNAGLKPMEETDRWRASVAQNGGMVFIRLARYGFLGVSAKNGADYIEGDAVFMQAFLMFVGVAAVWVYGTARKSYGDWLRRRGEQRASQAMY